MGAAHPHRSGWPQRRTTLLGQGLREQGPSFSAFSQRVPRSIKFCLQGADYDGHVLIVCYPMASRLPKLLPSLLGAGCGLAVALGSTSPAEAITYWVNGNYVYSGNTYSYSGYLTFSGTGAPNPGASTTTQSASVTFSSSGIPTAGGNLPNTNIFTAFTYYSNSILYSTDTASGADGILFNLSSPLSSSNYAGGNISGITYGVNGTHFQNGNQNLKVDYCNYSGSTSSWPSNPSSGSNTFINNCSSTTAFSSVTGAAQAPSPISGLMLVPLSSLIFLRKRFRKLVIKPLQSVIA